MINWQASASVSATQELLIKQLMIHEEVKRQHEQSLISAASPLTVPLVPSAVVGELMEARLAAARRRIELESMLLYGQQQQKQPQPAPPFQLLTGALPSSSSVGLEMLRAAGTAAAAADSLKASSSNNNTRQRAKECLPPVVPSYTLLAAQKQKQQQQKIAAKNHKIGKIYISEVGDFDVLCGRGGKSNHHSGNKNYRQVVSEMKNMYRSTETKTVKTDLSRAIVDHVCEYGGRFVKKEESTGRYYLLTKTEARKKTSQALRETKVLKWTGGT